MPRWITIIFTLFFTWNKCLRINTLLFPKSLGFSLCLNMLQYFYPQELSNYKVGIFPFVWLLGSEAAQLRKSRKSHISAYSDLFLTLCICSTLPTLHFWFYWIQFCIILPFHLFTYLVQRNVCFVFQIFFTPHP